MLLIPKNRCLIGDLLVSHNQITLFFAAKIFGNFAQQLVLSLLPGLKCPREDLLKMIAILHRGVEENNVGALFRLS